jgi:hypothetical protein
MAKLKDMRAKKLPVSTPLARKGPDTNRRTGPRAWRLKG